tara:strand:+ start:502 stop:1254 length:753 start_codon:yes stop_codon:yes gene_type:complete
MFNIRKVKRARKILNLLTALLFKLFQLNLRYKENRKDYGVEIFEYFYLPWKNDKKFIDSFSQIEENTINPKSRLYTIYEYSKFYLSKNSTFIEVGSWKGGVSGLVALTNIDKNIDIYSFDTFSGVKKSSNEDSFFKNDEYNDATPNDIKKIEDIVKTKINIVEGIFPASFKNISLNKPLSMAHIDVDTYLSAKESFEFLSKLLVKDGLIILDDYGGWFTDGVTKFGNELKEDRRFHVVPNHIGQLIIFRR